MSETPVKTQLSKTVLCNFYVNGSCAKGSDCKYAHSDEELRVAPDLTKTSLCKAWKLGKCKLGNKKCTFAHGVKELRITPHFLARNRRLNECKQSMQSKDSMTQATQHRAKQSTQPKEPSPSATSTATCIEQKGMTYDSESVNSVTFQAYLAMSTMHLEPYILYNSLAVIRNAANSSSDEAKISLADLSVALQLGVVGDEEDHALAQRLIDAMPQCYDD